VATHATPKSAGLWNLKIILKILRKIHLKWIIKLKIIWAKLKCKHFQNIYKSARSLIEKQKKYSLNPCEVQNFLFIIMVFKSTFQSELIFHPSVYLSVRLLNSRLSVCSCRLGWSFSRNGEKSWEKPSNWPSQICLFYVFAVKFFKTEILEVNILRNGVCTCFGRRPNPRVKIFPPKYLGTDGQFGTFVGFVLH
jgi:hypothetical protein